MLTEQVVGGEEDRIYFFVEGTAERASMTTCDGERGIGVSARHGGEERGTEEASSFLVRSRFERETRNLLTNTSGAYERETRMNG